MDLAGGPRFSALRVLHSGSLRARPVLERLAPARAAGFEGVEVHAGHGYLLSSFISPITNQRADRCGGSRKNRMWLPLEVIAAIRAEVGADFPVWIKLDGR